MNYELRIKKLKNAGFTLVETLVAITIFTMSILALMTVLADGISDTGYAKQKMIATYLAQEGIECIRNTRDNYVLYLTNPELTWNDFKTINVANIACPNIDVDFVRLLGITTIPANPDEVKISSTVSWAQGSANYSITFSENLFNWTE